MTALIYYDAFTGPVGTAPDPTKWTARTGNWKPGVQNYTAGQAALDGAGHLALTADRDGAGGYVAPRIDTRDKLEFVPPVRIRASIKMPAGAEGIVPAFWTMGVNRAWSNPTDWPECGEIDLLEWQSNHGINDAAHLGGRYAGITIHGPSTSNPHVDRPLTPPGNYRPVGSSDLSDGYHLWDLIWKPDRMIFAIDGDLQWDLKAADYTAAGGDWTPFSGAWPHYLLLNVAVNPGGSLLPSTYSADEDSPFPVSTLVDWIRVEQL